MQKKTTILFADDDEDILFAGGLVLRQAGYEVTTLQDPELLYKSIEKQKPDLILLDMNFLSAIQNGNEGLYWLRQVKKQYALPVVMLTAYGEIDLAVMAMKDGASDFITKPWENQKLLETIKRVLKKDSERRTTATLPPPETSGLEMLIGNSASIQELKNTIRKIAPTDASVMILGENGTGKELVAKAIHQLSKRAKAPFVSIDMGAIPDGLFESTLFGHKKGAFTDAKEDLPGRFVQADQGSLFLDEVGNIPLHLQSKLLVALQNKQVQALGDQKVRQLDLRIISATNAAIDKWAAEGKFRQDLLYRLNTVKLHLPPLRDRLEDLPHLADHFLKLYTRQYGKEKMTLSSEAMKKLQQQEWPGNIRELQHVLERAVILAEGQEIYAKDLLSELPLKESHFSEASVGGTLEDQEKSSIERTLAKHQGNISATATELGLSRAALYRRLSKYNL